MKNINFPTKLTLLRIVAVPVILVLLVNPTPFFCFLASLVFIAGGITDWLDGYIARSTNSITSLGKLLDPIADKLLILSVLIPLVAMGRVPAWLATLMLAREFVVGGVRMMAASQNLIIAANWKGKYKTMAELIAMPSLLLQWNLVVMNSSTLGTICLLVGLFFSYWGAFNYCKEYWDSQED